MGLESMTLGELLGTVWVSTAFLVWLWLVVKAYLATRNMQKPAK